MAQTEIIIKAKDKTKRAFRSVDASLKRTTSLLFNAKTAIAGLVGVGGFGALIASSLKTADALAKTSDKLGLTTEALAGLHEAAELSGVSTQTLDMAMQRMVRRLSEAAQGTGEAKDAIKELGLDARQLASMAPDQAFIKITKAMEGVSTQADRVRLAMRLFDSEGVALVNTMQLGAEGLRKAAEEAKVFGLALSRVDAAKIEQTNDAMTRIKGVIRGVGTTIAVQLAPYLTAIADYFVEAAKKSNGFRDVVINAIEGVVKAIGVLRDAIYYLNIAWKAVKLGAIQAFSFVLDQIQTVDAAISNFLDKIPGLDVKPSADLKIWADAAHLALDDAAMSLDQLIMQPRPSEGLMETFEAIKTKANEVATAIAASKEARKFTDEDQANLDAELDAAIAQEERLEAIYRRRMEMEKKLKEQHEQMMKARFNVAKGITSNLATLMASSSKREFELGKKFALANALVKGYEAITGAYAAGAKIGGPWLGAAYAAAAAIATKVQIDNIRKQTFSGGGGVSVAGGPGGGVATGANLGGGAPAQATTQQQQVTKVSITLEGNNYSADQVRELIDQINEQIGDGAVLGTT